MDATDTKGGQHPLENRCLSAKANTKQPHTPPELLWAKPDQTTHELDSIFNQMVYGSGVDGPFAVGAATELKDKGAQDGTTPNRAKAIPIEQQTMDSPIPESPSIANTRTVAEREQSDGTQHQSCSAHPPQEADQWISGTAEELDFIFGTSDVPSAVHFRNLEESPEVTAAGYLCFRGIRTDSAAACRTSMQSCID